MALSAQRGRPAPPRREKDLLDRCRAGQSAAWSELLDEYERLVHSVPLRYGLSREDAADVAQTTFTELLQSLDALREDERLAGWLVTVARRQSWRLMDRQRREPPTDDLPDVSEADPAEQWTQLAWLYEGLLQLDERCRSLLTALYLQEEEDPSYGQVAQRLGRPIGSIGPTRGRCLERLRRILSR